MRMRLVGGVAVALVLGLPLIVLSQVGIDAPRFSLVWRADATWASLVEKSGGRECCRQALPDKLADISVAGRTFVAATVAQKGDRVELHFEGADTVLVYQVEPAPDWVVFRLVSVRGSRPDRITLLRLPPAVTQTVGVRLNAAYDDQTTVCLMAANQQTDGGASSTRQGVWLLASTQDAPGPKLEDSAVALIVCGTPEFKAVARMASHSLGLLTNEDAHGVPVKDTELVRGSYWFISFGENDVDKVIEYCRASGFRQVMMSSGAWCSKVGHYEFNTARYPHGEAGLKAVVDRLHAEGILVGMHAFVSKVSKTDSYVTPVPDRRFWCDLETVLATDIPPDASEIQVRGSLKDWPGSSATASRYWEGGVAKHREVIIGDEIVQYEAVGPDGVWDRFTGCKRGAWGTKAAPHRAGDAGRHYGVDGCINGYIIDQETSLMSEVADRVAGIFNRCGFDMVYFDGGEDVDKRRYKYYVSNFQEQAMRRFTRRPIIHMGTIMTHTLWHSFARSATVDTYLNTLHGAIVGGKPPEKWPTVREHINGSVRYLQKVQKDMMPGELGWFGIWPKGRDSDGLQLDEIEYLMCKSLGFDVPISLETDFRSMEAHVLTPEILAIVREYEALRLSRSVPAETRARLQVLGKDFAMVCRDGQRHFVEVEPLPLVGGTHSVRACVGAFNDGSVATLWHYLRDAKVGLNLDPSRLTLIDFAGEPLPSVAESNRAVVPVASRRSTLICRGVTPAELRTALEKAEVVERKAERIFLRAGECRRLQGNMAKGVDVGVKEPEAFGDVLVCTGQTSFDAVQDWYAEYAVEVPREGVWTLWARVRYPSGTDDSFGIVPAGEVPTMGYEQVLGNCGVNEKQWHWTGRGSGSTAMPPGSPITLTLHKGTFVFRVYAREAHGTAASNPRLDLICLSDDRSSPPTDDEARQALDRK